MPAKSKAQQRFFGMVRAAQKGEGASSPEVEKVAGEISDKDAKKFAKTKHKGLPEKKLAEGDVPRNSMGKPIRIKDKIKAAKGFISHKGKPTAEIKESFTPHKMIDPSTKKEYWADTYDKHLKYKKMGYVHEEKKPRNCGCGKDPCITYGKKKEIKESVLDVVRKYGKKKQEKKAQKSQDAGARARRVMQRKEYASKVSGSTDNVPDNLRDSLQILKNLIK